MVTGLRQRADLFDRAPCGLMVAGTDGRILDINATLARWLGTTRHDVLVSRGLADLLTIGGRLFHQTHLAPLLQMQGSVAEVQLELRHRDGHTLPVLVSIARVRLTHTTSQDEYAFMLARDRKKYEQELLHARRHAETALDERRSALDALRASEAQLRAVNEQLAQANRRKDEFFAVLGHELRNPLAALTNALDLLRLRPPADPLVQRTLEVFQRQVGHIGHLSTDLMDAARIGQGKLHLDMAVVPISEVVRRARELAAPLYSAAGQQLVMVRGDDATVQGDLVRLVQVVGNLLNNASKYGHPGGTTWLSYERQDDWVHIRVRDNGSGIDPARLEHVFAMFEQLEDAPLRSQGGLGIGLALVKGLVELHGGRVRVHSEGFGRGSEFTVALPCRVAAAEA
jgi:PAS domain S-box-containing protein